MSILWLYDKAIDPRQGGTERATFSVMNALRAAGHATAGSIVIQQSCPRRILDSDGNEIADLYAFLMAREVHVVINQIGYSDWLLREFLDRGGKRWVDEGGRVITCLHFDPQMFPETLTELVRGWDQKDWRQKVRRVVRIALLPLSRLKAWIRLRNAYSYLIEKSDRFVILSESHRRRLYAMSRTSARDRVVVIQNPNSFPANYTPDHLLGKKKTVLVVSRLDEPQKRISLAILAWERVMCSGEFPDWTLKIVGDGDYAEDYRRLVQERKIENIEFFGRTDPEALYEEASLYLHVARREGWGLTITEAMQKGAVPLVMDCSSVFREIICCGESGILSENGDVVKFAGHMSALMRDPERRGALAVGAIAASGRNDIGLIVSKWAELLYERRTPAGGQ